MNFSKLNELRDKIDVAVDKRKVYDLKALAFIEGRGEALTADDLARYAELRSEIATLFNELDAELGL